MFTQYERTNVYGFGKSLSAKSGAIARKYNEMQGLVGLYVGDGKCVTGLSKHFIERAIERGVSSKDIEKALTNPVSIGKIKIDKNGRSQAYIGDNAKAIINPDTYNLITTWRLNKKGGAK